VNLRGIANSVSSTVNRNILVSLQVSDGWVMGAGQRQVPQYKRAISGPAQIQALDGNDLKQIEQLNLQGALRALYMYGNLAGVIRPDQRGGDLVTIKSGRTTSIQIPVTASQTGVITVPHGLKVVPDQVKILMTTSGEIWQAAPSDATNLYLQASDVDVSAIITVISNGVPQNRNVPATLAGTWLVEKVLESWSDWTKVVIRKQ